MIIYHPVLKNNLELCFTLVLSHFWLIVTKTNNSCLADKFPCVSNFCLLTSLLLRRGLNTWARFCLQLLAKFWWPAGSKKFYCWGTCGTLTCTAFRWCISWVGVYLAEVDQKRIFSKKVPKKQHFWGTQIWITWLWRGVAPTILKIETFLRCVLENLGHKLSDGPYADLLGSKLSDWRPFEFFTKWQQKMAKNAFFCVRPIYLSFWYWNPYPGYHHVKAHVLGIPKMWYFLGVRPF